MRLTKIIATLGPAVEDTAKLKGLLNVVNAVRLNFSHGTHEYHGRFIDRVRKLSPHTAILLDVKGPGVRSPILQKPLQLKKNEPVIFGRHNDVDKKILALSYHNFEKDVSTGDLILIDDGKVRLRVKKITPRGIETAVLDDCVLQSRKSVVVQGKTMSLPDLSGQDIDDINFGLRKEVDWIALSLVQKPSTVLKVKKMIEKAGKQVGVIAKIEHPAAVEKAKEIIQAADGVMVARGDLGLNMPVEEVPVVQKRLVWLAQSLGKPVIVATQMLESMVSSMRPTRAEVTDVANAVLDGADAVMLSEETAIGDFPVETVQTMHKVVCQAETLKPHKPEFECSTIPRAIALAASSTADCINAAAILTPTRTGFAASLISSHRLSIPTLAICDNDAMIRRLGLVRGVYGFKGPHRKGVGAVLREAAKQKMLQPQDKVVIVYKNEVLGVRTANTLEVRVVQEFLS